MSEYILNLRLKPVHPYYVPSQAFIERHGLLLYVAENNYQVYYNTALSLDASRLMCFYEDTGRLYLGKQDCVNPTGDLETIFDGFLPNEQALEQVIEWTKW